jgi:hypothetical protein
LHGAVSSDGSANQSVELYSPNLSSPEKKGVSFSLANKTRRILTQAAVSTHLPKQALGPRHRLDNIGLLMTKELADVVGQGMADIKKSVLLEGFREHADVLEVNNPDTASRDVDEEVILADVGVIDREIIWQRDGRRRFSWEA